MNLTQERLKELLTYSPETGEFFWRGLKRKNRQKGLRAGTTNGRGYRQITVDKVIYLEHRLAWLYMTGEFPLLTIDHKDQDKSNNKWDNLREATSSENQWNGSKPKRGNKRGENLPAGVYHSNGRYIATIRYQGCKHYLGCFKTPEEAGEAYKVASLKFHGEFSPFFERKENE